MHHDRFTSDYQADIQETVEKAMKCGTRDIGYAKYKCLGCDGELSSVFVCFTCKSRFCHGCGKEVFKQKEGLLEQFDDGIFNALVEKIEIISPTHFVFVLKSGTRVNEHKRQRKCLHFRY